MKSALSELPAEGKELIARIYSGNGATQNELYRAMEYLDELYFSRLKIESNGEVTIMRRDSFEIPAFRNYLSALSQYMQKFGKVYGGAIMARDESFDIEDKAMDDKISRALHGCNMIRLLVAMGMEYSKEADIALCTHLLYSSGDDNFLLRDLVKLSEIRDSKPDYKGLCKSLFSQLYPTGDLEKEIEKTKESLKSKNTFVAKNISPAIVQMDSDDVVFQYMFEMLLLRKRSKHESEMGSEKWQKYQESEEALWKKYHDVNIGKLTEPDIEKIIVDWRNLEKEFGFIE